MSFPAIEDSPRSETALRFSRRRAAGITRTSLVLIGIFLARLAQTARSVTPTKDEMNMVRQWLSNRFEGNVSALPFSFLLDGQSSSNLLTGWKFKESSRTLEGRSERTVSFTDPRSGLKVRCVAIGYDDFPTVEWTLYFKNTGTRDTPILSNVQALNLQLARQTGLEFLLHYATGSPANLTDFAPHQTVLAANAAKSFRGEGGRPTSADWSYFNLEWDQQGLIVAVGWPGQWTAEFSRDSTNSIRIRAGQEILNLKLHPGEEIRSPLIALQFWKDRDWIDAQNIWRHWMIKHNLPRFGGKELAPAMFACSSHQFNEMINANETNQIQFIDRYLAEAL